MGCGAAATRAAGALDAWPPPQNRIQSAHCDEEAALPLHQT